MKKLHLQEPSRWVSNLGLGIFKSQIFKMTNLENQNNNE
jgi:hypothetical protein